MAEGASSHAPLMCWSFTTVRAVQENVAGSSNSCCSRLTCAAPVLEVFLLHLFIHEPLKPPLCAGRERVSFCAMSERPRPCTMSRSVQSEALFLPLTMSCLVLCCIPCHIPNYIPCPTPHIVHERHRLEPQGPARKRRFSHEKETAMCRRFEHEEAG